MAPQLISGCASAVLHIEALACLCGGARLWLLDALLLRRRIRQRDVAVVIQQHLGQKSKAGIRQGSLAPACYRHLLYCTSVMHLKPQHPQSKHALQLSAATFSP